MSALKFRLGVVNQGSIDIPHAAGQHGRHDNSFPSSFWLRYRRSLPCTSTLEFFRLYRRLTNCQAGFRIGIASLCLGPAVRDHN